VRVSERECVRETERERGDDVSSVMCGCECE